MNRERRKCLKAILEQLEALDAYLADAREQLYTVKDEEQEDLDNMPESLQESEHGQQMQEYIDAMEDILSDLEDIDLEDIIDRIQEIVEC